MSTSLIRLIVADIDGCLSRGSTSPIGLDLAHRLLEINRLSLEDPAVPAVTYCTGRPQPYVECLMQVTGCTYPALCEGGGLLFDPQRHEMHYHEGFGAEEEALVEAIQDAVAETILQPRMMFEPGKKTHVTLLLFPPHEPLAYLARAQEVAARVSAEFIVEPTRMCLHFLLRGLNKGTGLDWLVERTGIPAAQMAGIGDARPDIPFLVKTGLPCAPANAHADVKAVCRYVSREEDAAGTLAIIDHIIAANRELLEVNPEFAAAAGAPRP